MKISKLSIASPSQSVKKKPIIIKSRLKKMKVTNLNDSKIESNSFDLSWVSPFFFSWPESYDIVVWSGKTLIDEYNVVGSDMRSISKLAANTSYDCWIYPKTKYGRGVGVKVIVKTALDGVKPPGGKK